MTGHPEMTGDLTRTDDLPEPFATAWAGATLKLWNVGWWGPGDVIGTAIVKAPDGRGACALCCLYTDCKGGIDLVNAGTRNGRPFVLYEGEGFGFEAIPLFK